MQGILSIQSHVSFGHAGNSSAVFPMQRMASKYGRFIPFNFLTTRSIKKAGLGERLRLKTSAS